MKKHRFSIFILIAAIGIVVAIEVLAPKPLDWTTTYALDDKKPFGSKIVFDLLPGLFPGQSILPSYKTLYERKDSLRQGNYIFITSSFDPAEEDLNLLLKLVSGGSQAFIATSQLGQKLEDTLNCRTQTFFFLSDTVSVNLTDPQLRVKRPYQYKKVLALSGFYQEDSTEEASFEVLGLNQLKEPNFVRIPWGKGWFYLQCMPQAYTNYNMLAGRNIEYIEKTLSYLPKQSVYWDELYKGNTQDLQTPFRFLIVNPPLRWALYLTMLALLLFMAFEAKRRQRIIPVIKPLANTTLEFTQTIGRLYYQHQDHKNIADKQIAYFLDYLRSHYFVLTNHFDEEFYTRLQLKTGMPMEDIISMFNLIRQIYSSTAISQDKLLDLNKRIDKFMAGAYSRKEKQL